MCLRTTTTTMTTAMTKNHDENNNNNNNNNTGIIDLIKYYSKYVFARFVCIYAKKSATHKNVPILLMATSTSTKWAITKTINNNACGNHSLSISCSSLVVLSCTNSISQKKETKFLGNWPALLFSIIIIHRMMFVYICTNANVSAIENRSQIATIYVTHFNWSIRTHYFSLLNLLIYIQDKEIK